MARSVIPWSWSSYEAYQTCPRRFYELKIAKNYTEAESEALIWGNEVHSALEHYIKDGAAVPGSMTRFLPVVDRILAAPGDNYAEMELACTLDLSATGFWDENAWCRGKGDLIKVNYNSPKGVKALNADWKTGKWKPGSLQLDVMAVLTFASFPDVEYTQSLFMYFQEPTKPVGKMFHRSEIPAIMAQFEGGVADMVYSEMHDVWPEKPSGLCRAWCPVKSCKYYQKGKSRW